MFGPNDSQNLARMVEEIRKLRRAIIFAGILAKKGPNAAEALLPLSREIDNLLD